MIITRIISVNFGFISAHIIPKVLDPYFLEFSDSQVQPNSVDPEQVPTGRSV